MIPLARHCGLLLLAGLLVACGGSNSAPPASSPPPSALSYGPAQTFTVGTAIAPLNPTVTGTVASYSVAPALPAGLALNTTSGTIAGTPTTVAAATNYTITASNPAGGTIAVLSIAVNDRAPAVSYPPTNVLTTGVPVTLTPAITGGTVTQWTTTSALPAGLSIDPNTGVIQGAPTAVSAATTYQVVAANSGGQVTAGLSIAVRSGILLELGHADEVDVLRIAGEAVLSRDTTGHWVLWDFANATQLAEGESARSTSSCCPSTLAFPVDLAGNTAVTEVATGLEIRDAADGHLLAFVSGAFAWWRLAGDGSYVAAGSATELRVWSRAGTELVNRTGVYTQANAFAAPNELRIARGPAGADVVQTVNPSTGGSTTSAPFLGTFGGWFSDGERFLTTTGTTVRVYSRQAAQLDIKALTTVEELAGYGDYFWSVGGSPRTLGIYRVGASATPAATHTAQHGIAHSGSEVAVFGAGAVGRVDLSGTTPVRTDFTAPSETLTSFAVDPSGHWLIGTRSGELTDETTAGNARPFGYGRALAIAGSAQRVAITTASDRILYYNVATRMLEGTIAVPSYRFTISADLSISADGSVLAAGASDESSQDRSINIFALPAGTPLHTWPYVSTGPYPSRMALSLSGTVLAQEIHTFAFSTLARQAGPAAGGSPVFTDTIACNYVSDCPRVFLSPDGTYVAAATTTNPVTHTTNLYENGVLVQAVPGSPIGWQTDDLVLVNIFGHRPGIAGFAVVETRLYDRTGQLRRSFVPPTVIERSRVQAVGAESLYLAELNAIYSTVSGALQWSSANSTRQVGAVAGGYVAFASGADIRIEPR